MTIPSIDCSFVLYFGSRPSWKCASELNACVSCTEINLSVSILLHPRIAQRMFKIHHSEKNFGRLQFRAKQVFENKTVEDFKRRNISQYSINFLSSSKTLSFHEATSSCRWNTVSSIWYIFSIESKTYCDYCKRKSKIVKMYANIHSNVKMYAT